MYCVINNDPALLHTTNDDTHKVYFKKTADFDSN